MRRINAITLFILAFALFAPAAIARAATFPAPAEGDWVAQNFRFHTGDVMPALRLHYTTVGAPSGEPVLLLHGTASSGASLLSADFGGELFGPGQPLDADILYQWDSSRDYNAAPGLEKIQASLLVVNSADDERNPPETGILVTALKRVKNGRLLLIPASVDTRGHGTVSLAKFWKQPFAEWLQAAPHRGG
jgi:homoserine acetyltransferase